MEVRESGNGLVELQMTFGFPSPSRLAIKVNELETCTGFVQTADEDAAAVAFAVA